MTHENAIHSQSFHVKLNVYGAASGPPRVTAEVLREAAATAIGGRVPYEAAAALLSLNVYDVAFKVAFELAKLNVYCTATGAAGAGEMLRAGDAELEPEEGWCDVLAGKNAEGQVVVPGNPPICVGEAGRIVATLQALCDAIDKAIKASAEAHPGVGEAERMVVNLRSACDTLAEKIKASAHACGRGAACEADGEGDTKSVTLKLREAEARAETAEAQLVLTPPGDQDGSAPTLLDNFLNVFSRLCNAERRLIVVKARAEKAEAQLVPTPDGAEEGSAPTLYDNFLTAVGRAEKAEAELRDARTRAAGKADATREERREARAAVLEAGHEHALGALETARAELEKARSARADTMRAVILGDAKAEEHLNVKQSVVDYKVWAVANAEAALADARRIREDERVQRRASVSHDREHREAALAARYKAYTDRSKELEDEYRLACAAVQAARAEKGTALIGVADGDGVYGTPYLLQKMQAVRGAQDRVDEMEIGWAKRHHVGLQLAVLLGNYKNATAIAEKTMAEMTAQKEAMDAEGIKYGDSEFNNLFISYCKTQRAEMHARDELVNKLKAAEGGAV